MHFDLVDRVLDQSQDRIVTIKQVSAAEEYLQDHFPTFPVLPGVMMLEAMVQAGRRLLEARGVGGADGLPFVLGQVRSLKYGCFVKPGDTLRVEVSVHKELEGKAVEFKGRALRVCPDSGPEDEEQVAVSGRFTLREARIPNAPGCPR